MLSGKKLLSALVTATAIAGTGLVGQSPASAAAMPRLVNYTTGLCATPYGGGTTSGTVITQWECNGDASQEFQLKYNGWYYYYNPHSKKCLSVDSDFNGGYLVLEPCVETLEDQHWLEDGTGGQTNTGNEGAQWRLITTQGGGSAWGTPLTVWDDNGSSAQNWGHR